MAVIFLTSYVRFYKSADSNLRARTHRRCRRRLASHSKLV